MLVLLIWAITRLGPANHGGRLGTDDMRAADRAQVELG
jgi:hypothetical protein